MLLVFMFSELIIWHQTTGVLFPRKNNCTVSNVTQFSVVHCVRVSLPGFSCPFSNSHCCYSCWPHIWQVMCVTRKSYVLLMLLEDTIFHQTLWSIFSYKLFHPFFCNNLRTLGVEVLFRYTRKNWVLQLCILFAQLFCSSLHPLQE